MNNYILSIFLLLTPISAFSQQTDSYVDSLFYKNIEELYEKCNKKIYYDPISDNRRDLYVFLNIFCDISKLDIIGICYQPPRTNYDKIRKLEEWYKIYGCCISKQDYLGLRRIADDIESFDSLDDYIEYQQEIYERIERKIADYKHLRQPSGLSQPSLKLHRGHCCPKKCD